MQSTDEMMEQARSLSESKYFVTGANGKKMRVSVTKGKTGKYYTKIHAMTGKGTLPGQEGKTPEDAVKRTQAFLDRLPKR